MITDSIDRSRKDNIKPKGDSPLLEYFHLHPHFKKYNEETNKYLPRDLSCNFFFVFTNVGGRFIFS